MPDRSLAARIVDIALAAPMAGPGREQARLALLDSFAVALAGGGEPGPQVVRRAAATGSPGDPTVWHDGRPAALNDAVLANAVAAHALDFDCLIPSAFVQPGAVLVPGLVAISERDNLPGAALLDALCRGLSVLEALGTSVGNTLHTAGWHPTTVLGVVASATASACLLGLDPSRTHSAVNIAVALSGGLKQSFGTGAKELQVGEAARAGVWAATLAGAGVTSAPGAADAWLRLVTGSEHGPDLGPAPQPRVHVKRYPCCGRMHAALDLAVEARAQGVEPREIVCVLNPRDVSHIDRAVVHNPAEAKFSIQYGVAATLLHGALGLDGFEVPGEPDPDVARLMTRVRIDADDHIPSFGTELYLRQPGGSSVHLRADAPTAASPAEVRAKFVDCARYAGRDVSAAAAFSRLTGSLDHLADVRTLVHALPGPAAATETDQRALEGIPT